MAIVTLTRPWSTRTSLRYASLAACAAAINLTRFIIRQVGEVLKRIVPSVVKREELFITSKLWNHNHHAADVEKELDETLAQLGTDYVDLYRASYLRSAI